MLIGLVMFLIGGVTGFLLCLVGSDKVFSTIVDSAIDDLETKDLAKKCLLIDAIRRHQTYAICEPILPILRNMAQQVSHYQCTAEELSPNLSLTLPLTEEATNALITDDKFVRDMLTVMSTDNLPQKSTKELLEAWTHMEESRRK